ncbi:MAG: hypothetical protein WKF77_22310 [Planctomycetaceae bacterium]
MNSTLTMKLDHGKLSGLLQARRGNADPVTEIILDPVAKATRSLSM